MLSLFNSVTGRASDPCKASLLAGLVQGPGSRVVSCIVVKHPLTVRQSSAFRVREIMRFRGPLQKDLQSSCADVGPEDGLDPRKDTVKRCARAPNRKALQLCHQIEQTLNLLLPDCGEELLRVCWWLPSYQRMPIQRECW